MKGSATIVIIFLMPLVFYGGCSREEPPPPVAEKSRVVRPIERPAPEETEISLTERDEKAKDEAKEAEGLKTVAVEEKALMPPETEAGEQETAVEEAAGFYIVKQGDSLSAIAASEDVYGDSLKWPFLYRRNKDELAKLPLGKAFPHRELPEGLRLRIISPDEVEENLKSRLHNVWVVNVLSTTTNGKIIPLTVRLIDNGYMTYITHAKVKGKDWTRLRVGFFKDRTEADTEGKKIMAMLNLADAWVIKVGKKEFGEFGGY